MTKAQANRLASLLRKQTKRTGRNISVTVGSKLYPAGYEPTLRGLVRKTTLVYFVKYGSRVTFESAHVFHPLLDRQSQELVARSVQ